jgi:hypothetical protein
MALNGSTGFVSENTGFYEVDRELHRITVHYIRHRRDVYRKLR